MNLGANMRDIDELKFFPLGCSSEAPPHSSIYQYSNSGGAGGLQRQGYGRLLVYRLQGSTHVCTAGSLVLALSWGFGVKMGDLVSD